MTQVEYLPDGSVTVDLDEPAWSVLDVFTWVAFGERRGGANVLFPRAEWSCDWQFWPVPLLPEVLDGLVTGVPWIPEPGSYWEPYANDQFAFAQRLMNATGKEAAELGALLTVDTERFKQSEMAYMNAKEQVLAAVRDGRLTVWARRRLDQQRPDNNAAHEVLDRLLFIHQPRVLNEAGWVECSENIDVGPWWDEVRLDREQVLAVWPVRQGIAAWGLTLAGQPDLTAGPAIHAAVRATIAGENRLQAWLEKEMRASPDASPGKARVKAQAQSDGYVFSGAGFERAWLSAVKATGAAGWSASGAKKKSKRP